MRLSGKVAIVTGAASGFGEGIGRRFAEEGCAVIRTAGGRAAFVFGDVSKFAEVQGLLDAALLAFGRLDIVVNNAGTTHRNQPLLEVTEPDFDRVYAVNVKSLYWTARAIVPHFRKSGGGCFVNVASTAGIRPRPGLVWYNGSKAAVITISKGMAAELGPEKIRVNCVNPVIGETGLLEQFMGMPDTPQNRQKFLATIPLGRFSTPLDVANACLYLASDDAAFVTGACLEVDGGRCV
jgi:3-oxoacyl-[acyl-carrier protein] reductase